MIDLHCHILPGLDDGARDIQDSVGMARQAEHDGISVVCATPHIRSDHRVRIEQIASCVRHVQRELADRGLGVQLVPGGELAEEEVDRLTDAQLRLVTLGGAGGWVLLEPAPGPLGAGLNAHVGRLSERGVASVIAHPERHAGEGFRDRLRELAGLGCLIQWTAEFIVQAGAGDLVLELADEGLVHLLGSDAHSSYAGRPARISAGFARLATVCSPARMQWIVKEAPAAVVRGEAVTPLP